MQTFVAVLLLATNLAADPIWERSSLGETLITELKSAPFPHPSRDQGFTNGKKYFPKDPHYLDGSVALYVPHGYRPEDRVDVLVYLHGHYNNVRRALEKHKLREQVIGSRKNVVLVFPEGPKDAGDSGCGKFEDAGGLKRLVVEALTALHAAGKTKSSNIGRVLMAGHSGAYRGISFCVERGGLEGELSDIGLIDASYGRLEAFTDWAARHPNHTLFSIFTNHLATENVHLMTNLARLKVRFDLTAAIDADDNQLAQSRFCFVHAEKLTHDQTVFWLERWLRTRSLPTLDR